MARLTIPQVMLYLGPDEDAPRPHAGINRLEMIKESQGRLKGIFDAMCAARSITPAALQAMPIDEAQQLFMDVTKLGIEKADPLKLRTAIIDYVNRENENGQGQ